MSWTLQAVDTNHTLLLDLNDGVNFIAKPFKISARDIGRQELSGPGIAGSYTMDSTDGNRTFELPLTVQGSSVATLIANKRTLAQISERDKTIIKHQPEGATTPVYLTIFRWAFGREWESIKWGSKRVDDIVLQAPCLPYSYGEKVNTSAAPVTGSTPCDLTFTNLLGDTRAKSRVFISATGSYGQLYLAQRAANPTSGWASKSNLENWTLESGWASTTGAAFEGGTAISGVPISGAALGLVAHAHFAPATFKGRYRLKLVGNGIG